MKLTKEEKATIEKVINNMTSTSSLFNGNYDAKHGHTRFMYGVGTVMEYLSYLVSDEYGDNFSEKFTQNMIDSEKKI